MLDTILLFGAAVVAALVFGYSLKRKVILNDRYWTSLGVGIRDWDRDAVQDAQDAVREEMVWTILLIAAMLSFAPILIGLISSLK